MFYLMYEKDEQGNNKDVRVDGFPVASGKRTHSSTPPACPQSCPPACKQPTATAACGRRCGCRQYYMLAGLGPDSCTSLAVRAPSHHPAKSCNPPPLPACAELLNELMGLLRERVKATPILRHKLFQVCGSGNGLHRRPGQLGSLGRYVVSGRGSLHLHAHCVTAAAARQQGSAADGASCYCCPSRCRPTFTPL
jgi:hypothetical protein